LGKTIEDAEVELFGVRGWTKVPKYHEEYRWQAIRDSQPGCGINHIFNIFLAKTTPEPARLPILHVHEGEGWYKMKNGGCVYIPKNNRKTGDPEKDFSVFIESLRNNSNSKNV